MNFDDFFSGRKVLVTGGAGFIGSNLVRRLVDLEAQVTVVDSLLPEYGGNLFNLHCIRDRIWLSVTDMRDANGLAYLGHNQTRDRPNQMTYQRSPPRRLPLSRPSRGWRSPGSPKSLTGSR